MKNIICISCMLFFFGTLNNSCNKRSSLETAKDIHIEKLEVFDTLFIEDAFKTKLFFFKNDKNIVINSIDYVSLDDNIFYSTNHKVNYFPQISMMKI